ncbi:MAG: hypothetical protein ACI9W2_002712 [Gammaproteobacteria bacterium]|jgi:hypothetical protein
MNYSRINRAVQLFLIGPNVPELEAQPVPTDVGCEPDCGQVNVQLPRRC